MRARTNARRDIQSRYLFRSEQLEDGQDDQERPRAEIPYLDAHGSTQKGFKRTFNDDHYVIADLDRRMLIQQSSLPLGEESSWRGINQGRLLVVAEGIANTGVGAFASRIALDAVMQYITTSMPWMLALPDHKGDRDSQRILEDLECVIARCEDRLRQVAECYGLDEPLASTMTLAYAVWPNLYVVHAGTGGCYLLRGKDLYQLTSTHATNAPAGGDAMVRPLTGQGERQVEVHHVTLKRRDRVLLCTEGLTRHLGHDQIAGHLGAELLSANVCEHLMQAARQAGALDSVTAVVCRFG